MSATPLHLMHFEGGDGALGALMLGDADVLDWEERLVEGFSAGSA